MHTYRLSRPNEELCTYIAMLSQPKMRGVWSQLYNMESCKMRIKTRKKCTVEAITTYKSHKAIWYKKKKWQVFSPARALERYCTEDPQPMD